jgi:tryptophan synthase beta chain
MQWGLKLSKMEGIIPAIETLMLLPFWTKWNSNQRILWLMSGRGDKDLNTYIDYFK